MKHELQDEIVTPKVPKHGGKRGNRSDRKAAVIEEIIKFRPEYSTFDLHRIHLTLLENILSDIRNCDMAEVYNNKQRLVNRILCHEPGLPIEELYLLSNYFMTVLLK